MMWSDGQPITADDFLFWYEDVYSNQELMPTPSSVMVIVSFAALLLTWVLALPIGIYSAVQQYSIADYAFTFIGLIGLAVPNFLLAIVLLYLGFIPTNIHLIGVDPEHDAEKSIFLLGTDIQGRDLWARVILASRISMTIGLVGVTLSLFLGVSIGDVYGLYGGLADTLIRRVIEILRSLPTNPLWMGLGAHSHAIGRSCRCFLLSPSSSHYWAGRS
jgi:ABC-type dipeptide/oligopeptide/nickel transport system permease subunit